ncbi:MAG: glycogen-binding domain-containing protein [Spirochaetaceae bacterium]|jgi:hypothetical protein|nr:glycogen-binding domain-containing protein [Spirochaetaceae bacterium]
MRTITTTVFLTVIIGSLGAIDTESYQFIDHLLSMTAPGSPELYEDTVIFTAPSTYRRVGLAFAHEGFAMVHWFQKIVLPDIDSSGKKPVITYTDSGILFYAYTVPDNITELEYRLVIDGLWTTDPANPLRRLDMASGIMFSVVPTPIVRKAQAAFENPVGELQFTYTAPPGETITVAGSFNNWDPFMYTLQETKSGIYTLKLHLPPGIYQYVFFHRGERVIDSNNARTVYTREGRQASEAIVR